MTRRALRFPSVAALEAQLGKRAGETAAAVVEALAAPKPNKYHAQPTTRDGIRFPSKREARRYDELVQLKRAGLVLFFLRQVPMHLPGGTVYRLDFLVFWADGRTTWEDAKGRETQVFKVKRREIHALYPIRIVCV